MSETADEAGTAGAAPVVAADAFTVPSVLARRAPTHAASLTTAVVAAPEIVRSPVVLELAMRKLERWTATALSNFEEDMSALAETDDDAEAIVQLREALGHVSSKVKMNLADVRVRRPSPTARAALSDFGCDATVSLCLNAVACQEAGLRLTRKQVAAIKHLGDLLAAANRRPIAPPPPKRN